jgi:hypothetical protein
VFKVREPRTYLIGFHDGNDDQEEGSSTARGAGHDIIEWSWLLCIVVEEEESTAQHQSGIISPPTIKNTPKHSQLLGNGPIFIPVYDAGLVVPQ